MLAMKKFFNYLSTDDKGRHDTQHNDIQHNDIKDNDNLNKGPIWNSQHQ